MTSAAILAIVWLSVKVAIVAVLIALPLANLAAYWLARSNFVGKGVVNAILHLPLVMPPVVTGYVLLLLFGRNGPIGQFLQSVFGVEIAFKWTGAAVAAAVMAFPLMVRPLRLAYEAIEPRIEDTARTLGASRLSVFFTVSLPLAVPGLIAGGILGFAKALGDKAGLRRYGSAYVPLDEAMSRVVVDFSGRPGLVYNVDYTRARIGDFDVDLVREFFQGFVNHAGVTLHIDNLRGINAHHQCETIFKAFARALRQAAEIDPRAAGAMPSTKGTL